MKETLKLTPEEGRNIVWEDSADFKLVKKEIEDSSRWSIIYVAVFERLSDGKLFKTCYSIGATESQDERPFEYDGEAIFTEVQAVEKTVIVYE